LKEDLQVWENYINKKLHNFHCSPNVIKFIKSRKMKCIDREYAEGRWGIHSKYCPKPAREETTGRPSCRWRGDDMDFIRRMVWWHAPVVCSCKHVKQCSVCLKGEKFIDQLRDYQLLRSDSATWSTYARSFETSWLYTEHGPTENI